jgi:hypothetical protein
MSREAAAQPIRGFGRTASADRVLHDEEILSRIERLSRAVQLVGEGWTQPVGAGPGVALQQQHAVHDLPSRITPRRPHRAVVQPQFRH